MVVSPAPAPAPPAIAAHLVTFPSHLDPSSVPVIENDSHTTGTTAFTSIGSPNYDFSGMDTFEFNIAAADPEDWNFLKTLGLKD